MHTNTSVKFNLVDRVEFNFVASVYRALGRSSKVSRVVTIFDFNRSISDSPILQITKSVI